MLRQVVGAREQARREVGARLLDHLDARLARHAGEALDEDLAFAVRQYAHLPRVLGSVGDVVRLNPTMKYGDGIQSGGCSGDLRC